MDPNTSLGTRIDSDLLHTALGFMLYGTKTGLPEEHLGDRVLARKIRLCSKALLFDMSISEPFWERNVKVIFKTCENDYLYKIISSWEQLFCRYSKDDFKINIAKNLLQNCGVEEKIEKIVDYCHRIYKSKNTTAYNPQEILELLYPFKDYLSDAKSNAEAQFFLGNCQSYHDVALKYLYLSADQENAMALLHLGLRSYKGKGVYKDLKQAFDYFKRAADLGNASAQFNVGDMYKEGVVTEIDPAESFKYTKLSADQGHASAIANLGYFYLTGFGTNVDEEQGFRYISRAAYLGIAEAQYDVGNMYRDGKGTKIDPAQAFKYTKLSADQGFGDAQASLGQFYFAGIGTKVNHVESFKYTQMAANQGHDVGLFNLGYCYREGIGTYKSEKNLTKALKYTQKSLNQGHISAQKALNEIKKLLEHEGLNGS
jgi:TPR repeat protein